MKQNALLLFIYSSFGLSAQCALFPLPSESHKQISFLTKIELYHLPFTEEKTEIPDLEAVRNKLKTEQLNVSLIPERSLPKPPQLNTKATFLEVCEGSTTTLSAISDYPIEWYSNYPPEGEPLGTGSVFVTPILNKGYYIYHAVANNQGIKSKSSEMEVVMVYPLPFVSLVSATTPICSGEFVTLSAFGTRFYSWSTGETNNEITIQPKHTSTYEVTGINTAGCKHSVKFTQVVENCAPSYKFSAQVATFESKQLSVMDNSFKSSIYPNPNTGEFHLQLSAISEFTRIEVHSAFGELVYADKALHETTTLNLSHVNKGIYTLRILEKNLILSQQKIVIEQ
jgi:hypothetical protein